MASLRIYQSEIVKLWFPVLSHRWLPVFRLGDNGCALITLRERNYTVISNSPEATCGSVRVSLNKG